MTLPFSRAKAMIFLHGHFLLVGVSAAQPLREPGLKRLRSARIPSSETIILPAETRHQQMDFRVFSHSAA
jgi:hypothetical protein